MSSRPAASLIEDIIEAISKIERYIGAMTMEQFMDDEKSCDAVVRNLEIIGEAANRIPIGIKSKHTEIEWNKIVGLRHRIVHGYFDIDRNIIWMIAVNELPVFKSAIRAVYDCLDRE